MVNFKGSLLYFLIRLAKPQLVVETGVAAGVSTSFILQAIKENGQGRLISIDLPGGDPEAITADRPFGWIVPEALRPRWKLVLGDVRSCLNGVLASHPEVDMVVHDDMKEVDHRQWEFQTSWIAMAPGGVLVSDDVELNDAFFEFCRLQNVQAFDAYDMGIVRKPA